MKHKVFFTFCNFTDKDIAKLAENDIEIINGDQNLSEEDLISQLKECDGYVIGGNDRATQKVVESTNLDIIVFHGTGYENYVDMKTANQRKIVVTNTPFANAYTVAEHSVALILAAAKEIPYLNNSVKDGEWDRRQTWNLQGKTLGVIGLGHIGSYVAKIMHDGFGMNILYVSRENKLEQEKQLRAKKVSLEELLKSSDVVAVHAAYNDQTVNMISEKELSMMKKHAVLVCTSRVELVDPKALKEALTNDKLAIAAFDGYYQEPAPTVDEDKWGLLSLPDRKFIITPHTAYNSKEALNDMNQMVIENLIAFFAGKRPPYQVN